MSTNTYQPLSTEKYWIESVQDEVKVIRRAQRRQAVGNILTTVGVIVSAGIAFVATMTSADWIPMTLDFLRDSNIISM